MYYILILIILIFYYIANNSRQGYRENRDKRFSYYICIILVLLAAFRSDEVGADTPGYRIDYKDMSFFHDIRSIIDRHTLYYIGYFGLSKLFHMAGLPVQVWFGFVEAVYLYSLMRLVDKFSKDRVLSLLVFTTIGLFTFSLAGLKQTLASAMVMLAFVLFTEKRYIYAALLVVLAYFTHQAALIMLGAFPIYLLRNNRWLVPAIIGVCVGIYLYSFSFMETMVSILENDHFESYLVTDSEYSYVTFIFYATIVGVSCINIKGYSDAKAGDSKLFLSLSALGCALQLLAGVSPSLFRLALLYTPFFMILIPNTLHYSNIKYHSQCRFFIIASVIFYFLYTGRENAYSFFWNG